MKILITLGIILSSTVSLCQELAEIQYEAYLRVSKTLWEKSISIAEKEHGTKSFERATAIYGLLNSTMASKDEDTFDKYVDTASDLLKDLIESQPNWGEPKAVLSAIYGLRIAYSPWKGMLYGSKSGALVEEAYKLQPESALVQKLYASSKLYTPEMFGGDVQEAREAFKKAIELFEASGDTQNWLYLDTLIGLGFAHQELDNMEASKKAFEKALQFEPEFGWAKSLLSQMK